MQCGLTRSDIRSLCSQGYTEKTVVGKGDREVDGLHLRLTVLPQSSNRLNVQGEQMNFNNRVFTYPFELAAHEQHASPNPAPSTLLARSTLEVSLTVTKQDFRQASEAAEFILIHLTDTLSNVNRCVWIK